LRGGEGGMEVGHSTMFCFRAHRWR
jgi:hypothetical protein